MHRHEAEKKLAELEQQVEAHYNGRSPAAKAGAAPAALPAWLTTLLALLKLLINNLPTDPPKAP